MTLIEFQDFLDKLLNHMKQKATVDPDYFTHRNGDGFEICVVEMANEVIQENNLQIVLHHTPGSHAFPDIVVESENGEKYGIEVKSSKSSSASNWTINGNSVVGSTSDHSVIDTYILFGKLSPRVLDFRTRRYRDSISKVVVTHSPRYFIDLDVSDDEVFFEKSGIEYETMVNSDNPIALITDYYRSQGMQAWWLSESTPAALRLFSELNQNEQNRLIGYGFAHFPELFSKSRNKYKRFAMWLASEQSIVAPCLRDDFSASGKVSLLLDGNYYTELPQLFKRLRLQREYVLSEISIATPEKLGSDWGCIPPGNSIEEKIEKWITIIDNQIPDSMRSRDVNIQRLLYNIIFSTNNQ